MYGQRFPHILTSFLDELLQEFQKVAVPRHAANVGARMKVVNDRPAIGIYCFFPILTNAELPYLAKFSRHTACELALTGLVAAPFSQELDYIQGRRSRIGQVPTDFLKAAYVVHMNSSKPLLEGLYMIIEHLFSLSDISVQEVANESP